ncbi:IucA/IucC family C-terminal-domain containing protein [Bacillus sp. JCM 19041]|uniref:IucA/IucC family C-terminal-domain containing protein n=1 Tax=Bacillus sp. JCM 19041 TaxID=1460637 RepID=UPI0006CF2DB0
MYAIDAPNLKVAASLFIKHYARVTVASTLHHLALHNGALRFPPMQIGLSEDNKTLYVNKQVDHWIDWSKEERECWRTHILHELFCLHITPLLMAIKKTTSIPYNILWENVSVRINSIYRKMLAQQVTEEIEQQLTNDFCFLQQADGQLFGCNKNPISHYLNLEYPEDSKHPRRTCCFYYQVGNQEHCNVCPLAKTALIK